MARFGNAAGTTGAGDVAGGGGARGGGRGGRWRLRGGGLGRTGGGRRVDDGGGAAIAVHGGVRADTDDGEHHGRPQSHGRPQPAHPGSPRGHSPLETRQSVAGRHHGVSLAVHRVAQQGVEAVVGLVAAHEEYSRVWRKAATPREAWLLTAPVLMPIASAIWASDRSP